MPTPPLRELDVHQIRPTGSSKDPLRFLLPLFCEKLTRGDYDLLAPCPVESFSRNLLDAPCDHFVRLSFGPPMEEIKRGTSQPPNLSTLTFFSIVPERHYSQEALPPSLRAPMGAAGGRTKERETKAELEKTDRPPLFLPSSCAISDGHRRAVGLDGIERLIKRVSQLIAEGTRLEEVIGRDLKR